MASRVMHFAVASQLEKVLPIKDRNRFYLGHILPDAVLSADKKKVNSHFIEIFDDGRKKHFDFYGFYDRYKNEILSDDLYLGYYFHLIEDNMFRVLIYYELGLLSRRGEPALLDELYRDYHILNGIVTEKYALENTLYVPSDFSEERINEIYPFEIEEFISDMNTDFGEKCGGHPKLITARRLDKYISGCVNICSAEYDPLKCGRHYLGRYDFSFDIK